MWIDLGTGGGFPGFVLACALAGKPGAAVHLVESNLKKAAFLREAQRLTGAVATVHAMRVGDFVRRIAVLPEVVTARAISPLKPLIQMCYPLLGKSGVTGLFLKGQNAELEVNEAAKVWAMDVTLVPSRTDRSGRIVVIRDLERVGTGQ